MTPINRKIHDSYDLVQLIFRGAVPILTGTALLIGGIWLLTLPLPGWKLILGLPAAQLGIVVLMFAFDDVTKKHLHPENYEILICPYCSNENLVNRQTPSMFCGKCQKKIMNPEYGPIQTDED